MKDKIVIKIYNDKGKMGQYNCSNKETKEIEDYFKGLKGSIRIKFVDFRYMDGIIYWVMIKYGDSDKEVSIKEEVKDKAIKIKVKNEEGKKEWVEMAYYEGEGRKVWLCNRLIRSIVINVMVMGG